MGPDEVMYSSAAQAYARDGIEGLRRAARNYIDRPALRDYPSPIRWLWTVLVRHVKHVGRIFFGVLVLVSGVVSPLALAQSRALLQDGAVALQVVGAVLAARGHHPVALGLCTFVAMCLKPEALLGVAAGALAAWPSLHCVSAISGGAALGLHAAILVFGPSLAGGLLHAIFQKHDHAYGLTHQRGMPHRLVVDLCMVAPFAVLWGPWPREAIAIVAVHALSPVRNVRTIIAAEVLLRMYFVHTAPWWVVAASFVYDLVLWRKLLRVYDPVTDELRKAVC